MAVAVAVVLLLAFMVGTDDAFVEATLSAIKLSVEPPTAVGDEVVVADAGVAAVGAAVGLDVGVAVGAAVGIAVGGQYSSGDGGAGNSGGDGDVVGAGVAAGTGGGAASHSRPEPKSATLTSTVAYRPSSTPCPP